MTLCLVASPAIPALAERPVAAPTTRPFRVLRGEVYARTGGQSLLLDLYLPADARKPRPLVLYIHGGDWMFGNRSRPPVLFLLDEGIAVASIEYRLAPRFRFPSQVRDCRDALLYLKANAARYGLDAGHVGLIGESAGGHLAALLATAPDEKAFVGTRMGSDAHAQAVCAVSGPMDIEYLGVLADAVQGLIGRHPIQQLLGGTIEQKRDLAIQASPVHHISTKTPPFLLIYGNQDFVVPPILNRDMAKALTDAGVEVEAHEIQGMGHDMMRIWDDQTRRWTASFFRRQLIGGPATRSVMLPERRQETEGEPRVGFD